jgi:formylglycine-generating enzyme required for sulfatase activity
MRKASVLTILVCLFGTFNVTLADTFGTGANQFNIDFVNISGDSGDLGSWSAGFGYTFSGVNHGDYRMGTYEITNDQWNKFQNSLNVPVTGSPSKAYDGNSYWMGTNIPFNCISWYEAAQFVNWLNTSKGYQAAYKFNGTQGTSNYTFETWQTGDTGYNPLIPYRNSNAFYFLPTEDEWVKAAYWNGTNLQTFATPGDIMPVEDKDSNYNYEYETKPWNVGNGSVELNGTFDIMGNVREWTESPWSSQGHIDERYRCSRGGSYYFNGNNLRSSERTNSDMINESRMDGFRVASVPEPATLLLLALGGLVLRRKK